MKHIDIRRIIEIPTDSTKHLTRFVSFNNLATEHFAVLIGHPQDNIPCLVRIHSECITGDLFMSRRCDCGPQLQESLISMNAVGHGVLIYLRQEGRGIGLYSKFDSYALQNEGVDTFTANEMLGYKDDLRDFDCAAEMLHALTIDRIKLLTNNPLKVETLIRNGIIIQEIIPSGVHRTPENEAYLKSKAILKNHTLRID